MSVVGEIAPCTNAKNVAGDSIHRGLELVLNVIIKSGAISEIFPLILLWLYFLSTNII